MTVDPEAFKRHLKESRLLEQIKHYVSRPLSAPPIGLNEIIHDSGAKGSSIVFGGVSTNRGILEIKNVLQSSGLDEKGIGSTLKVKVHPEKPVEPSPSGRKPLVKNFFVFELFPGGELPKKEVEAIIREWTGEPEKRLRVPVVEVPVPVDTPRLRRELGEAEFSKVARVEELVARVRGQLGLHTLSPIVVKTGPHLVEPPKKRLAEGGTPLSLAGHVPKNEVNQLQKLVEGAQLHASGLDVEVRMEPAKRIGGTTRFVMKINGLPDKGHEYLKRRWEEPGK